MSRRMIPNLITAARLALLPVFVLLYSLDAPGASWPAAILVLVMALSDILDGWLARRYGWQSSVGKALDPITDRLFFVVLVATLLYFDKLPLWAVLPVVLRDVVMVTGGILLTYAYHQIPAIMRGGRAANVVLISGVQFLIIDADLLGHVVYAVGAIMYVVAGLRYVWREWLRWRRSVGTERGSTASDG
jgi:CDP-diacylglycerol--glycerol-3-phosphate 3-phosphatidyltransferase